jgi:RNA polymerase sigma-70 factor (ECF subfamily)
MTGATTQAAAPAPPVEETFESLLATVLPRAYAAARHLAGDPADAEDLVQEAALLAWKGFGSFTAGTNFRAWFLRILTNAFYMKYRRERRERTVSLDGAPELFLYTKTAEAGLHEGCDNPAQAFLSRLETEEVARAIQALPAEYRAAATLYFVEDLSYQDIADILGCPVGTVRSRLHRARKMLQVALWHVAKDHGIV